MKTLTEIRSLLLALRSATDDPTWSHAVDAGRFQLQRIEYDRAGNATVTPVSAWRSISEHAADLRERVEASS